MPSRIKTLTAIGDRRWCNGAEMHPKGPSAFLPAGVNLTSLHCPRGFKLVGCVTDRRDFYHQAEVSRARAWTNQLPFAFATQNFFGSAELKELEQVINEKYGRVSHGDRLGLQRKPALLVGACPDTVYAGFKSLFQGDHLGVEYALASHSNLLRSGGLLTDKNQVLRHRPFPRGPCWETLVIDDYVIISKERVSCKRGASLAEKKLEVAEAIYKKAEGRGIFPSCRCRDSIWTSGDIHRTCWGCRPCCKNSLDLLPFIEGCRLACRLASRLAGQWISLLMFRRFLTCTLDGLFRLGAPTKREANDVVTLHRSVAEELVLASIGGFLAVTDISVGYDEKVYAADASNGKGAVTACKVPVALSELLWLGGDRKGAYTTLDKGPAATLRQLGIHYEEEEVVDHEELLASPPRVLDFAFDFVEICGGSGVLSEELAHQGLRVCSPIDLTASKHYDLTSVKLLDWILQMIQEKRFKAVGCEPPCTTFSPAQHPASRSYENPLGFDRKERHTLIGTTLALRCLTIMLMCFRVGTPAFL